MTRTQRSRPTDPSVGGFPNTHRLTSNPIASTQDTSLAAISTFPRRFGRWAS